MHGAAVLKSRKGFTLIELISVIVIIGILAAVAVPTYNNYITKSRNTSAEAAIAEVKSRLSLEYSAYLLKNKNAPPNMGAFLGATARNNTTTIGVYATDIGTGFSVALTNNSTTATITVSAVKEVSLDTDKTDTWELP